LNLSNKLEVRLLGKFEVSCDGKPIAITSRPAQSLFAYLILNAGTAHRREKLAGLLWPDSLEETARDNLRHALWRIRKVLPSMPEAAYLLTDDLSIAFNASAEYWLDAAELERISDSVSADELMAILSAYQGELLPGFYDEWVVLEREHLYSIFEHHMARLMSLLQTENRWLDILDWGERWIKLGQKPEPAYRALMSAHAAKGDMSKVAATYERCVKSLREFGVEPSEQTNKLYESLKSGKDTPKPVPVITKPATKVVSSNIPVPLTSFIGRQKELKEIARLLSSSRLLTLTGPGGVGKTRLAIQTAHDSIKKFKDGVFWVGLVGLSDANLIPQEIAPSLNVREVSNEPLIDTLKDHLKFKDLLLILDNCEHLIEASAHCAEQLLAGCAKLKILATSRERLGLFNETTWPVPSLPLPEIQRTPSPSELEEYASVALFAERARAINSDFLLTAQNATAIAQICQRLDGIPLAIELAAARIKVLSVDEIASHLTDRFSVLTSGSRTALPRHQTLRATIDWSYDLLTEPERILFRRLAIFAGGFTLEGIEEVCSQGMNRRDLLDLLGRLVDKSLVMVDVASSKMETRYHLLETIREYARQKMDEADETTELRNRHLAYFVGLAEEAEKNTFGADSVRYHQRLDQELDDIRTAMKWSIQARQATMAFRLGAALFYFSYNRSPIGSDWQRQLNKALQLPEGMERTAERAQALNAMGYFYWADVGADNPRADLEEALSIARELGNNAIAARSLCNLGLVETVEGNYEQAGSYFEQSMDLFRKVNSLSMENIWPLTFLGDIDFYRNDLNSAQIHYEQSVSALRGINDRNFLAYIVRRLGQLAWHRGEFDKAARFCHESLTLNQELGDERGVIASLAAFAGMATAERRLASAAQLFGAVETLSSSKNIRLVNMDRMERERNQSILRDQLSMAALEKSWKKGSTMTTEQAVEFALKEIKV
jgi:predicted ATPase/DNA-binding SARP family transcriptional activator